MSGQVLATLLALLTAGTVLPARAAAAEGPTGNLKEFLFGHRSEQSLAPGRYSPADGQSFVVDRPATPDLLLRFDDTSEVLVLKPTSGPRGDVIYKDDTGQPILRATRLGGLTLFTQSRPAGAPAAWSGESQPLKLPPLPSPNVLFQTLVQASLKASRAAQHLVMFEAQELRPQDVTPASGAVFADAAWTTAEAFARMAGRGPQGRQLAARFAKVQFIPGREPSAHVTGTVIQITVSPERGFAGRPSSARIVAVLSRK
jgi:hypothetical protein